jgi:serine/threonine-protein kinase mTOR
MDEEVFIKCDLTKNRLMGVQRNVDVWQRLLKVRALVISPQENMDMWIKFANLCRKSNRMGLAEKTLHSLLGGDDESHNHFTESTPPQLVYAWLKFAWARGEKSEALSELQDFSYHLAGELGVDVADAISSIGDNEMLSWTASSSSESIETTALLARCFHKQAEWQVAMQGHWIDHSSSSILQSFSLATQFDPNWHKAWHSFAIAHFDVVSRAERAINDKTAEELPPYLLKSHVIPAIKGFFRSISLSARSSLQDTLRLLRLMFRYGNNADVNATLSEGFATVNIDTWLEVIPQVCFHIIFLIVAHRTNPFTKSHSSTCYSSITYRCRKGPSASSHLPPDRRLKIKERLPSQSRVSGHGENENPQCIFG